MSSGVGSRSFPTANEALRIAAVVGQVGVNVVAAVSECSRARWSTSRRGAGVRLVDEVADRANRLTFSHALVRSTLIDELSTNGASRKRIGGR
jgi:hypothetical protein